MSNPANTNENEQSIIIDRVVESARILKEEQVTGEVEVSKEVHEKTVSIPLETVRTSYHEERFPHNVVVEERPVIREEDGKIIVPVIREESIVVKQLVLVEEIHLTPTTTTQTNDQDITLREEIVTVNRR